MTIELDMLQAVLAYGDTNRKQLLFPFEIWYSHVSFIIISRILLRRGDPDTKSAANSQCNRLVVEGACFEG